MGGCVFGYYMYKGGDWGVCVCVTGGGGVSGVVVDLGY